MNRYVISFSQGGLSNRIKCLVSSIKIAKNTGRKVLIYWPKNVYCNCRFNDLFSNKIEEISREAIIKIIKNREHHYCSDKSKELKDKKFLIIDNSSFIGFSDKNIHLKYKKIPVKILEDILASLRELNIKKDILKEVSRFSKRFNNNTIGVHIRKGDFIWLKSGIGKVSDEDCYIEEIKKEIQINPKSNFFLATEDPQTEKKFKAIFNNKISAYPKKKYKREDEGSVQEAFIELLLLSKTKKILGAFGSTFTELSWYFGECKSEIKIIENKVYLREFIRNTNKDKGVIQLIKQFLYRTFIPESKRIFRVLVK